jgi:iron complex outermembrane recepter protein
MIISKGIFQPKRLSRPTRGGAGTGASGGWRASATRGWMSALGSLAVAMSAFIAQPAPVIAQQVEASATSGVIEEVVVTARFRIENLQKTPLAITATTGETLEARGASDVTDLAAFVPNAVIQPLGAGWGSTISAFIRGVGLGDNSLSFEPGVPIYVDDVYMGRPQGAILDLLDLERVEVLRGPQGTLFGKNAIGGTVRLISKKPQGDGHGSVELEVGDFGRVDLRGTWDVALLPDKLFARFSGSSKHRDGYVDILDYECVNGAGSLGGGGAGLPAVPAYTPPPPTPGEPAFPALPGVRLGTQVGTTDTRGCVVGHLGGENVQSARAAFRLLASEGFEINLVGDYTRQNQEGPADKYTVMDQTNGLVGLWNGFVSQPLYGINWDDKFLTTGKYTNYNSYVDPSSGLKFPNVNNVDHWGVATTIDWDVASSVHLKSVTAYRRFVNSFGRDSDGSPLPFNVTWDTSGHRQFSEELEFTGKAFDKLDWTVGAFYYDADDRNQGFQILAPEIARAGAIFATFPAPDLAYALGGLTFNHFDDQTTKNYAGFVHGVYQWNDKLSMTLGVRYTKDKKEATLNRFGFDGNNRVDGTVVNIESNRVSPKAGFEYQFDEDLMGYIEYSTGFRGGGFGPRPQNQLQVASFQPEDLETLEVGMKSEWADKRVRLNSAVFYSKYTNQILQVNTNDSSGAAWFRTVNGGKANIYGLEVELLAEPVQGLRIQGSLGYLHYLATDVGPGPVDPVTGFYPSGLCIKHPNGDPCVPPRSPTWNYGLSLEYQMSVGSAGSSLTWRADTTYQDDVYYTDVVAVGQKAYSLVNARVTWNAPQGDWSVSLFGNNLTDEYYFNGKLSLVSILGFEQGNPGEPREWGLSVKRRF